MLRNGFSIRHERRQVIGTITRLYMGGDESSFVDVPTLEIDHIEELPAEAAAEPDKSAPESAAKLQASAKKIAQPVDLNEVVNAASGTYRLDPDLVNSVIRAESGFNVHAVSPKGAQGLMQLMPKTASDLGVQNAFDPQANVEGGTRYLRELLERYDFDLVKALAAYKRLNQLAMQVLSDDGIENVAHGIDLHRADGVVLKGLLTERQAAVLRHHGHHVGDVGILVVGK